MRNLKTLFLDTRLSMVLPFNYIWLSRRDQRLLPWHKLFDEAEFYCWSLQSMPCIKALKGQYFPQYRRTVFCTGVEMSTLIFLIVKRMQSTKSILNSSAKWLTDGGIGLWRVHPTPAGAMDPGPAGAMDPAHQIHTVIYPSLLDCPLIHETSFPQCKVKCSLLSTYANHSWNKCLVCILVVWEGVIGEYCILYPLGPQTSLQPSKQWDSRTQHQNCHRAMKNSSHFRKINYLTVCWFSLPRVENLSTRVSFIQFSTCV